MTAMPRSMFAATHGRREGEEIPLMPSEVAEKVQAKRRNPGAFLRRGEVEESLFFAYPGGYRSPSQSQPWPSLLGGKNSSTGKHILRNRSQGLSLVGQHSLLGIQ